MFKPFRTAAVLGAGVMGSQIAAHLANAGLSVHLLDLPAPVGNKNDLVETAFNAALKLSPPIFFTEKTARRVTLGNFEQHFDRLKEVDWVIEAVVEDLPTKQALMSRLEVVVGPDAIVSTNTSGLSIQAISRGCSDSFRQRFLGTHFFNPPRYLKLLELIPTPDTDPLVLERLQWFARLHLGKGIVVAKDTPNFIANRIGLYATLLGLRGVTDAGYRIEEIDTLTGPLVGRPKSATFRTADLVGLDTLVAVTEHLYPAIPEDESRQMFQVPELLKQLVAQGRLGAKVGQGFYRKQGGQILSLNPQTLAYEPAKPLDLGEIESIAKIADLKQRLPALYRDRGRAGSFFRESTLSLLGYCARRIPEVTDDLAEIDRAIRWGFGWEVGPFELWDSLGFEQVLADMETSGIIVPAWVTKLRFEGATGFYQAAIAQHPQAAQETCPAEACFTSGVVLSQPGPILLATPTDEIHLSQIKADLNHTLWQNSEAALLDIGQGVALYEFRSKGNTLSLKVVEGLAEVLSRVESGEFRGLVIGNDSANFSGGANLAEMAGLAQSGNLTAIANLIDQFQSLLQRIHYAPRPIVAAIQGRVLGGGTELVMACPQVVAAAETYIGLVELSVGLIPGAGGIMRMVSRAVERAASEAVGDIQPFLQRAFETIAMAKVSSSAQQAQDWGYLPPTTQIVMNGDRRLFVAKQEVLRLDREGYTPPPDNNAITVLGHPGRAILEHAAYIFQQGGFASDYDRILANHLAYVMTGGDLSAPALVSETYLLQLERERFIPLLSQSKTQDRIAHMLRTKKPLRN
ncbi:MAG: 3-hydroxyacyl-CoA dehydrogenase/enoyl-CoA hydratase family protein [Aphanocapsa sp. GSE-SYN-MK-11-07L]|jgi:3-hydroxyacyl-CoA dehydrogenase|nr:3-hydroxyacyl-CoA dehydrogenase/enoyl-CoA hydratase family protein [Aphanocapsa sp. GSE-SYN-MK-11-07L]